MSFTTGSSVIESHEEPVLGREFSRRRPESSLRRRRHSSFHPSQCVEADDIYVLVNRFVTELNRRLDFLESYGQLNIDAGVEFAWSTLQTVRDACSRVSDSPLRCATVLVSTLEERYNNVITTKDSLEQKLYEGMELMESLLADFEARAYDMKDMGLGTAAYEYLEDGAKKVGESVGRVKDVVESTANAVAEGIESSIASAVETALQKAREKGLISLHEIPEPWRVNEHILSGYRFHDTKLACLRSTCTLSNELFNIWSHAIGFLIILTIAFYFYPTSVQFPLATKSDIAMAGLFFFAACKCMVCSTMWHTFNSIAEQDLMERFACVDYTGISLLIASSIMTTEYTAFYCEPTSRWLWIAVTAAFGIAGTILPWNPYFNRADKAWLRVAFFVGLATTGAFPVMQIIYFRGARWALFFYAPITKSVVVYLSGAILYALKVPERWLPGWFDYLGGSHNIWHVAVLGGILFHYHAMQQFFAHAFTRAALQCSVY